MNAIEIFLILFLGHLASDFLLQTDAMVKAKKHGGAAAYWRHGLVHYVAIVVVTSSRIQHCWRASAFRRFASR